MLKDILPAKYRKAIYSLYAIAVVIAGALAVGGVDTGTTPDVLAYLGGALGVVAAANAGPTNQVLVSLDENRLSELIDKHLEGRDEAGAIDTLLLLTVLILVGVVLLLFRIHFH